MDLSRLLEVINAMSDEQKKEWKRRLEMSFGEITKGCETDDFLTLVGVVYGELLGLYDESKKEICYGVGKIAEKNYRTLTENIHISEFWDLYNDRKMFNEIPVLKPHPGVKDAVIVICVNKVNARNEIYDSLREMGYENLYFWNDYVWLKEQKKNLRNTGLLITDESKKIIKELTESFQTINNNNAPVLFSVIPKSLSEVIVPLENEKNNISRKLKEKLKDILIIDSNLDCIDDFFCSNSSNALEFTENIEVLLRNLLRNGVKTKERPIRMAGDYPYDCFAVSESLWIIIDLLFGNRPEIKKRVLECLKSITPSSMIINSTYCKFLCESGELNDALKLARKMVHAYPNELLSNETLFQVAMKCRTNGIAVEDDLPEYDLNERFCWSGISFAWCGGFDLKNERADFGPCFRPLQCAARPDGDFWTSGEWKEFRKSITDGSFRYCQKTQCANIVAGWLPKKSEFLGTKLGELLGGNFEVIPELEELHFSYDMHCNLRCPSCRTETQSNSKEKNEELDNYYEKYLKKYVKTAKHLCLSGCGEALLSPHSKKLLQSLSPKEYPNLEVELRTNMTLLNERTWESLGEGRHVIKHIAASIDAAKKETFEELRYPAKWNVVYRNLQFVKRLRDNNEIDMFEFHVVVQKANICELLDIVKLAIEMHADTVTFSKMINWRNMPQEEYDQNNPYWIDNPDHDELMKEMDKIEQLRSDIENGNCKLLDPNKKMYINIHFRPDPNDSYNEIRTGRIRIR